MSEYFMGGGTKSLFNCLPAKQKLATYYIICYKLTILSSFTYQQCSKTCMTSFLKWDTKYDTQWKMYQCLCTYNGSCFWPHWLSRYGQDQLSKYLEDMFYRRKSQVWNDTNKWWQNCAFFWVNYPFKNQTIWT